MELNYQGNKIEQREKDNYVNLTQMCKANDKLLADWARLESTKAYNSELSTTMGIPIDEILIVKPGSPKYGGGSWGHPLVAIALAQWISPEFHVWCNTHIKTLMEEGYTSLSKEQVMVEYMKYLPNLEMVSNPMLKSLLEQRLMEEISSQRILPGDNVPEMCILTTRAKFLGYSNSEIGNGSALGKYVAKQIESEGRQPHGRYYVHTYLVTEELDECIHEFFDQKGKKDNWLFG